MILRNKLECFLKCVLKSLWSVLAVVRNNFLINENKKLFILLVLLFGNCWSKYNGYHKQDLFSLFINSLQPPTKYSMIGNLKDENQQPLAKHKVIFEPIGLTIITDEDGNFQTELSAKTYTAVVASENKVVGEFSLIVVEKGNISLGISSGVFSITINGVTASPEITAVPVFTPSSGTYNTEQLITIETATSESIIYYTIDGTNPNKNSLVYTSPIEVSGHGTSLTIKAIAMKSGLINSSITSGTWTINHDVVAAPTFSLSPGTYNSDQTLSISTNTSGAVIYYTTDGTDPTDSSLAYTNPISISEHGTSITIKAIAIKSGMLNSLISSGTWTINYETVAPPMFTPNDGVHPNDLSISISSNTVGATIYYTTNGTNPTTSSFVYTTPISVLGHGSSVNIKAIAVKSGMLNSAMSSGTWTVVYPVATPTFTPAPGFYNSDQTISISVVTTGATIHYTTDGTDPTTSSPIYTSPISVVGHGTSITIKAMAVKTGMLNSSIASGTWNIDYTTVATPSFSPSAGTYNSDQTVSISTNTSGATIYYTTDGSNPTTSSPIYTGPIPVNGHGTSLTIKAIATKPFMFQSDIASGTWVIDYDPVATPTFTPSPGYYSTPQYITITTSTPGATIHYTLDGTNPTLSSPIYTTPFHIWSVAGRVIKAMAIKSGMANSAVLTGTFSYPPVNTGQNLCWDDNGTLISCTGTKHDGDLQTGVARSYADNGDGTITDNATGLIWQKCSRGQTNNSSCSGSPTLTTWTDALTYCSNLSLAGKTWRLPAVLELETLIDYGVTSGSDPMINLTYFPNTPATMSSFYWTSTNNALISNKAWIIFFYWGDTNETGHKPSASHYVRCVSGMQKEYIGNFTDNGDGTVKHNVTGLIWQKCSHGQNNDSSCSGTATQTTWLNAISYCNNLNLGGRSWRLPTINELKTLFHPDKNSIPTIDTTFFPNTINDQYWSSTTYAQFPHNIRPLDFNTGGAYSHDKFIEFYTRCVSDP